MSAGGIIPRLVAVLQDASREELADRVPFPWFGLLLFLSAVVTVPVGLAVLRRLGPRAPASQEDPPWNSLHALTLALVAFVVLTAASLLLRAMQEEPTPLAELYVTVAVLGVPSVLAVALAAILRPRGLGALGFAPGGNVRAVAAGVFAYLLVLPAWTGFGALWTTLVEQFGREVPMQGVMEGILELDRGALVQAIVIATVVAPLCEELLFRGFLQPLFVRRLGVPAGIGVTSLLFAVLHGYLYTPPLFLLGCVLGVVRWRTGRLSASWAVHGFHNGLTLFLVLS